VEQIARLQPFIGSWSIEASISPGLLGSCTFEWTLGGAYVLQRSEIPHPQAPDGLCLLGAQGEAFMQHYFDSRGVTRLYAMTFDGNEWTLRREEGDFSPLDFAQRYIARFSDDGNKIEGAWEIKHPGGDWKIDFQLDYTRVS
jgi:hypothetical protein